MFTSFPLCRNDRLFYIFNDGSSQLIDIMITLSVIFSILHDENRPIGLKCIRDPFDNFKLNYFYYNALNSVRILGLA